MKTPYQRIMAAARRGTGTRLTASEVFAMSRDSAIRDLAENDDVDAAAAAQSPEIQQANTSDAQGGQDA